MNQKKILFLTPYPFDKAPSQRLKFEQYYDLLREKGYEIEQDSFFSNYAWSFIYKEGHFFKKGFYILWFYILRFFKMFSLRKYDVVYVHLWVTPIGIPFFEVLTRIMSKRLIYDIDDMVFIGHSSHANRLFQAIKGTKKMIYLMKKSDYVITCTPTLDEFVRKYNSKTIDISSTVDTLVRYQTKSNYTINKKPIIGWSGSHSTSKYLYLLEDVFKELAKEIDFTLLVMGDASFAIEGVDVESISWSEEVEMETLNRMDIGLYPLPDEDWVYGKSGLKAIQYMALGIPTIATAIGANFRIISDAENGYLIPVDNIEMWKNRILELINNEDLRKTIGEKGRRTIVQNYSIEANVKNYIHAIEA